MKEIGEPKIYLGMTIGHYEFGDGTKSWYMSAESYLEKAIPVIEDKWGMLTNKYCETPLPYNYHPELDVSPELSPDLAQLYGSYVGILQWAVELGRIDITLPVSIMAWFTNAPREDHMHAVLRIFAFLKKHQ